MLDDDLRDLLHKEPFEPFRIRLVNGDVYDIFYAQAVAVQTSVISISPADQTWAMFPIDKIACLESLIADFPGETARHEAT